MKIIASILLVFAIGLSGCQTFAQKQKEKGKKATVSKATAKPREENADVDFEAFVGRLRKAVAAHDVQTLSAMMTNDFGYQLNPEASGSGVFGGGGGGGGIGPVAGAPLPRLIVMSAGLVPRFLHVPSCKVRVQ